MRLHHENAQAAVLNLWAATLWGDISDIYITAPNSSKIMIMSSSEIIVWLGQHTMHSIGKLNHCSETNAAMLVVSVLLL